MPTSNEFLEEQYSSGFEIQGVTIEQTLSESFDPFRGLDVNTNTFQNTNQSLKNSNQDGRVPLGCFVFDEDNIFSDEFPISFRDDKFKQIPKQNLIINGNGKGVQSEWTRPGSSGGTREFASDFPDPLMPGRVDNGIAVRPYLPIGKWGYCTFDAIPNDLKNRNMELYEQANLPTSSFDNIEDGALDSDGEVVDYVSSLGQQYLLSFEQTDFTAQERFGNNRTSDNNDVTGSSGWYGYFFDYPGSLTRPQVHVDMIQRGYKAYGDSYLQKEFGELGQGRNFENQTKSDDYSVSSNSTDTDEFFYRLNRDSWEPDEYIDDSGGNLVPTVALTSGWSEDYYVYAPNIAKWIKTDEASSYGKCLEFLATNTQESHFQFSGTYQTVQPGFDWEQAPGAANNQYRSLNQVCEITNDTIVQHTGFKIKFKMKTDSRFYNDGDPFPTVELSLQDGDGSVGDAMRTQDRSHYGKEYGYYYSHGYWPHGEFNSQRYGDVQVSRTDVSKRFSNFGSMGRFQNTILDEWEEFEYTFTGGRYLHYWTTRTVRKIFFMVQTAGKFLGRVLLDDFELIESYDFTPDCDVRKKIAVGEYGKGDLTKYYDKELQPEEYKDSTAPLEAQFYFYPTYRMDRTFDVRKTPMYRDFKNNLFYIYDVDWGDGSPREFTSEPEPINEEKALYHQYNKHGIFEVTGTMIRMKPDNHGIKQMGIAKHQKFTLRININEGIAEDFEYFGSDGFSFIPFRNSTPIIGGYSEQSAYYKSIKRQLGFIGDIQTTNPFTYEGDILKTQIAFERMDLSLSTDLNLLSEYKQTRQKGEEIINNGLKTNSNELGKTIGDTDITSIKYYNEPKSIWEMFGFNENDLNPGIPNHRRYWKNIIPEGYSIFNRQGISTDGNIDIYSEQDWIDIDNDGVPDYYYPVLPKYGADGKFLQTTDDDGNPIIGVYPITTDDAGDFSITEEKKPFPLNAPITTEIENNRNLMINITSEKIENNVFNDISGNQNFGFGIQDYSPKFSNKTLSPEKTKVKTLTRTSTNNGAF